MHFIINSKYNTEVFQNNMETTEYLAFVPLLIYGIGLADLLGEWKRLFDPKE